MPSSASSPLSKDHPSVAVLDREIVVVGRAGWLLLGATALLMTVMVVWSFVGELTTKVNGRCLLTSSEGLVDVKAGAMGRLAALSVRAGDAVRAGDVVATIAQPDQDERIKRLEARLGEIERRAERNEALSNQGVKLGSEAFARRQAFLERQTEVARSRAEIERNRIETLNQLVEQRLATKRSVEDAIHAHRATELSIEALRRQLADLERERTDLAKRETEEKSQIRLELAEAGRELALARSERRRTTEVKSAFSGRVVEIKASRGSLVSTDSPIVLIERTGDDTGGMEVVMYVASKDGKKIIPGMSAELLPATALRNEHGFLTGKVSFVSDYPATPQALLATLGSEDLVKELITVAAPFEVRIRIETSNGQPVWTRVAADVPVVRPGTLCSGEVAVRRERPIGFVIPALRKQHI